MKQFIGLVFLVLGFSFQCFAGKDITRSQVEHISQLNSDPTIFEFYSSVSNQCGTNSYRVKSPNETIANRKFAIVLAAFTANKNLAFHDASFNNPALCESGRAVVEWVRISN